VRATGDDHDAAFETLADRFAGRGGHARRSRTRFPPPLKRRTSNLLLPAEPAPIFSLASCPFPSRLLPRLPR
jgi:hypothetical protein